MPHGTRCFTCRSPVAPTTTTRSGRITFVHQTGAVEVPDTLAVCGACRPEITDLVRHWGQRTPMAATCSFCDDPSAETALVELASVAPDGRPTSRGVYLLCPACVDVFENFLRDVRRTRSPEAFPSAWEATRTTDSDVYDRREMPIQVVVSWDEAFSVRLRVDDEDAPLGEESTYSGAVSRARQFASSFEATHKTGASAVDVVRELVGDVPPAE